MLHGYLVLGCPRTGYASEFAFIGRLRSMTTVTQALTAVRVIELGLAELRYYFTSRLDVIGYGARSVTAHAAERVSA